MSANDWRDQDRLDRDCCVEADQNGYVRGHRHAMLASAARISDLTAKLERAREALEFVLRDPDVIGMTRDIAQRALSAIEEKQP